MTKEKVAVIKTRPKEVLNHIDELLSLTDIDNLFDKEKNIILKDNISWHIPFLSANTTPWQLEGTIQALKKRGYHKLVAVHNNTVVTDPFKGGRLNRLTPIYKKYGIPEKYNFRPQDMNWITYKPRTPTRILHKIYPKGIRLPDFFFGKNIIHLPTVKCHIYTTTTGAMKNAFGGLLNTKRHYTHSYIHDTLVDLLTIQKEIHPGIFTVMDGTVCGNGPGPRTMKPVQKDIIMASADSVAIDAIAAKIMGFDPFSIDYIRMAHEAGLGLGRPEEIEVVGEDISGINFGFCVGDNCASRVGKFLWFSPLKALQRLIFHTPFVYILIFGSSLYHDYIWWPSIGKFRMKDLMNTDWGMLFSGYPMD
jgi:uncharacterized protein (DUF362 family)